MMIKIVELTNQYSAVICDINSPSHEVFKYGGFSCRLSSHYSNLRQVDGVGDPELGEDILHPIHDRDEGLHPRVTRHLGGPRSQLGSRQQLAVHVTAANMRLQRQDWGRSILLVSAEAWWWLVAVDGSSRRLGWAGGGTSVSESVLGVTARYDDSDH